MAYKKLKTTYLYTTLYERSRMAGDEISVAIVAETESLAGRPKKMRLVRVEAIHEEQSETVIMVVGDGLTRLMSYLNAVDARQLTDRLKEMTDRHGDNLFSHLQEFMTRRNIDFVSGAR